MRKGEVQQRLAEVSRQMASLKEEEADLRGLLIKKMKPGDTCETDGFLFRLYQKENVKVDEEGLIDALPEEIASRVTVRKLDPTKLEAAIELGDVPQEVIEAHRSVSLKDVLLVRRQNGS